MFVKVYLLYEKNYNPSTIIVKVILLNFSITFVASLSLCPVAPVLLCLSDPARSTRCNLPTRKRCFWSPPLSNDLKLILIWYQNRFIQNKTINEQHNKSERK